ncbi:tRNA preQ1(34) S-adenosylmethionine ribosyltransferase-isomerase QueA [Aliiroseovarius sp. F20344]|uniref:tRNA preQ1(34) S-adenosylmethionine ribosyltransferase-isomerase QueA n=1 Tax=Aliiroseovarius sp. F20344 TaxID=2926414 RepID=UPI001FF1F5B9|nr:tRNA preQ1(34) S-adenosylmethionine ribosyltransferase-isomerase QueA [Aliiroseovarius sp. F20344]MCK0143865.1 tRNA preQ1(34) S-adenosylmethionine ribosyltransferase-isomerase QueA [Aliiroseovarius sp. F20344]
MKLSDFDFDLPEDLIATRPVRPRTASRMLVATGGGITDAHVSDLTDWLKPGDRLILNDTKVIPGRLFGTRTRPGHAPGEGIANIEVTLLSPDGQGKWHAMAKPLRKLKEGDVISFSDALSAEFVGRDDDQAILRFNLEGDVFDNAIDEAGKMPLPPYIAAKRAADDQDNEDYQTVFARNTGAVAAPTASLHFDEALLARIAGMGVGLTHVTLHVGAGTFLPVKVDDVSEHKMHAEWGEVSPQAAREINATKAAGGRVIPVGTTALRLIESAAISRGFIAPWVGETDIFITPGFRFQIADALMTNFHLPKSTLMMLVSALMGTERMRQVYDHAIDNRYRFFSYGDSSLLLP